MPAPGKGRAQRIILDRLAHGGWVHGSKLAAEVGVPPKVLWPYIRRMRNNGMEIEGEPGQYGRGYRMP